MPTWDPPRVTIVESDGVPRGGRDVAHALAAMDVPCATLCTSQAGLLEVVDPGLIVDLVGRLDEAAALAARWETRGLPFTGPTARSLARAARASGWRALVHGVDVMRDEAVIEGEDVPVAVIGNDPVLIMPGVAAGDELPTAELANADAPDSELEALVRAVRAALELRDAAYLVVRTTPGGHLWLAEVDPLPSLAADAPLVLTVERERWTHEALVHRVVLEAWRRLSLSARPEAHP